MGKGELTFFGQKDYFLFQTQQPLGTRGTTNEAPVQTLRIDRTSGEISLQSKTAFFFLTFGGVVFFQIFSLSSIRFAIAGPAAFNYIWNPGDLQVHHW